MTKKNTKGVRMENDPNGMAEKPQAMLEPERLLERQKKKFPHFKSDEEAEAFVATADLSEYDLSGFRRMSEVLAETEMQRKSKTITFRLSETLLDMLKAEARALDMPYQRLMRRLLAKGLMKSGD